MLIRNKFKNVNLEFIYFCQVALWSLKIEWNWAVWLQTLFLKYCWCQCIQAFSTPILTSIIQCYLLPVIPWFLVFIHLSKLSCNPVSQNFGPLILHDPSCNDLSPSVSHWVNKEEGFIFHIYLTVQWNSFFISPSLLESLSQSTASAMIQLL